MLEVPLNPTTSLIFDKTNVFGSTVEKLSQAVGSESHHGASSSTAQSGGKETM